MYLLFVKGERGLYSVLDRKLYFPHRSSNIREGFVEVEKEIDCGNYSFVVGKNVDASKNFFSNYEAFSYFCSCEFAKIGRYHGVDILILKGHGIDTAYFALIDGDVWCVFSGKALPLGTLDMEVSYSDIIGRAVEEGVISKPEGTDLEELVFEKIVNSLYLDVDCYSIVSSNTGLYSVIYKFMDKKTTVITACGSVVLVKNKLLERGIADYLNSVPIINIKDDVIRYIKKYHIIIDGITMEVNPCVTRSYYWNDSVLTLTFVRSNMFRVENYEYLDKKYGIQEHFDKFDSFKAKVGKHLTAKTAHELSKLDYESFQLARGYY